MTRILVAGSYGLLGCSLVPHLRAQGCDVVAHARSGPCDVQADLIDKGQANALLDSVAPNVIVNLAALTNVDECERYPHRAYLANVRIVENLVLWIQNNRNACHLVQLSTDQVYDGAGPHEEDHVLLRNYYSFSKYAGEKVACAVPCTILRTNFFGRSRCKTRSSFSDWLVESLMAERIVTVFNDIRFSPLSLMRLVELVRRVIEKRESGTFNVGSKDGMSKADFAFRLASVLGLPTRRMSPGTSDNAERIAYRPKDMRLDSSLFEDVFDVDLPTLEEEIHSMKTAYDHQT